MADSTQPTPPPDLGGLSPGDLDGLPPAEDGEAAPRLSLLPGAQHVPKPWGSEQLWASTNSYAAKLLTITEGHRLSLQYHREKEESILVLSGRLRLHLEDDHGEMALAVLGPGQFRRVPPGRRHRFEAVTDVEVVEVSSPQLDDVVRLEDDYDRA